MKNIKIVSLIVITFFTSCSRALVAPEKSSSERIANLRHLIWRGGADSFAVFENGEVHLYHSKEKIYIKMYKKMALAKSIFKLVDASDFLDIDSNIDTTGLSSKLAGERDYQYVRLESKDKKHEVYWRFKDGTEESPTLTVLKAKLDQLL